MNTRTAARKISILGVLAAIAIFAAAAVAQNSIEGKWKITAYKFEDKRAFPLDKMDVTLTVGPNNHIGGRSACNLYSGTVSLGPGGAMKLSTITMTEMACNELNGSFEGGFLDVLSNAARYDVKGNTLTITDTSTGHFLRFQREGKPLPVGKPPVAKPKPAEREIFFIGNKMSKCAGTGSLECLRIRKDKNGPWQDYYDSIIGFKPKTGRFYKIEVERVGDPPSGLPGDVTVYRHKLVRILKTSTREKDIYR